MNLEEIYFKVGKEDKVCTIYFKEGSNLYKDFGERLTGIFLFTQKEREELDQLNTEKPYSKNGVLKFRYLGLKQNDPKYKVLLEKGVNSEDIFFLEFLDFPRNNLFHSKEKRQIKTINISIKSDRNGKDYDWIYGFKKKIVSEGSGMTPNELNFYLACKLYYDENLLSEEENKMIFESEDTKEIIEFEFLKIKYGRKETTEVEEKRLGILLKKNQDKNLKLLDHYLNEAGSSLKKLIKKNNEQAVYLFSKIEQFNERNLSVGSKHPIYLDKEGYLHIYMRHVQEFKINQHFEHKDNFQWDEDNVFTVIKLVIEEINQNYQDFKKSNPNRRYSRYGEQSVYFEGDYYTLHIEPNGRISTFHKNKKLQEHN